MEDIKTLFSKLDEKGQNELLDSLSDEDLKGLHASLNAPQQRQYTGDDVVHSAGKVVDSLVGLVSHPVDTAMTLRDIGRGAIHQGIRAILPQKYQAGLDALKQVNPQYKREMDAAGSFADVYKDRYGSVDKAMNTFGEDPIGVLMDASGVSGLAGVGLRAAGATRAANTAARISRQLDPVAQTVNAATTVAKPIYTNAMGATTGLGTGVIEKQLEGGKAFVEKLRDGNSNSDVLNEARGAFHEMKEQRGADYRNELAKVKSYKEPLTEGLNEIKSSADEWLTRYNVGKGKDGLDFTRSSVTGQAANEVEEVYKMIQDWGSKAGDATPEMLDILKRRLGDFNSTGRNSRAMITSLEKTVENKIVEAVPEYKKMTSGYAKSTELLRDIDAALSTGDRKPADLALRKIMQAVREDGTFRSDYIKKLSAAGKTDIEGATAGLMSQPLVSSRRGPLYTMIAAGGYFDPKLLGLMAIASPRVVAEASLLFGRVGKAAEKLRGGDMSNAIFQSSRVQQEPQQ